MEKVRESEKTFRGGDSGIKYLYRGPEIDWGICLLKPGEKLGAHYHNKVEETFFVLEGSPTFYINEEPYESAAGDAFRCEPHDRHDIHNLSDSSAKMIFIKAPYLPEDKVSV
jgi:quercetin dioxygenase-like cupin family protein